MGLAFYVRPEAAAKLVPASSTNELLETEKRVLEATSSYKSSYNGMDRYEMARSNTYGPAKDSFPSRSEWEAAKVSLIEKKLLNNFSLTVWIGRARKSTGVTGTISRAMRSTRLGVGGIRSMRRLRQR